MKASYSLLALALLPATLRAQTPDDSLKGRIWTATAARIWADTRPRAPQPPAWPTNAAFKTWLSTASKNDNGGLGLLLGDVIRATGKGQPATAAQVAQAILAEASQPPKGRDWLQKVNLPALQAALHQLVPAVGRPGAAPAAAAGAASPVLTSSGDSLGTPLPPDTAKLTDNSTFLGRHPWLAGLLGALLGAGGTWAALRSQRRRSRHHRASSSDPITGATITRLPFQDGSEILRLQNEVQRLVHYIKGLEAKVLHYENANSADAELVDAPEPALEPPVAPAQLTQAGPGPTPKLN